jgi:hypothetical protein
MGKSIDNGFTAEDHFYAVSKVKNLYRNARPAGQAPDKHGDPNILSIRRFSASLTLKDGRTATALITVKEYVRDENKIYSLELKK